MNTPIPPSMFKIDLTGPLTAAYLQGILAGAAIVSAGQAAFRLGKKYGDSVKNSKKKD